MRTHRIPRRGSAGLALVLAGTIALSGCGSRQSVEAIAAANGPGGATVTGVANAVDGLTGGAAPAAAGTTGAVASAPGQTATTPGTTAAAPTVQSPAAGTKGTAAATTKGATAATANAPKAAGCTQQLAPITIGQVGGFTGIVSNTLAGAKYGMAVWVAAMNARGGLACHPIRLVQADDASDPSKSSAAVRDLVQNKGAVALVGSSVPISIKGFRAAVEELHVPAVGGDSLNFDWNQSPYLFPQGTTFAATIIGAVRQNVEAGHSKIGLVYCVEANNCTDAYQVLKQGGAQKAGAQVVYETQMSITGTDFSAQCRSAQQAGADQLLLAMDGSAIQRFLRSCAALNYFPAVATSAIATGSVVSSDPNAQKATVSVAHIVFPWMRSDNPAEQAYAAAMKLYAPDSPSDGATSQAWVAGEMLRTVVESLGAESAQPITTALVLKGLGNLKHQTFGGLTPPVTFTPGQKSAPENNCYYPVLLSTKGWNSPSSKPVCFS
jgi:branched-chain amino acid transport system substrate-binding protein